MLNKSTSRSEHVVQSGVTQYPIGFAFQYNGDGTPQIRVTIGDMVAKENVHYVISKDLLNIKLISLGENDKWVGSALVIERDIPFVQESDYQVGRISPEQIEKDFDLSVMRDQVLAGQIKEHADEVQGEIDALHSRIDYVQEEHALDMAAVDEVMATKATKAELESAKTTLNSHTNELTTLRDQVSGIEEKIPGDASGSNPLATKADLANIDLDGYVKKSGDTMTGDLVFDVVGHGYTIAFQDSYKNVNTGNIDSVIKRISSSHQTQGLIFSETKNGTVTMQFTMIADGFFMPQGNRLLGSVSYPWENVYAKKLNNGADLNIPTEGGTLARLEDLEGLGGGDYLPLAGGTLEPAAEIGFVMYAGGQVQTLSVSSVNALATSGAFQCGKLYPKIPKYTDIGESVYSWRTIYVTKMNNGADLAVPTEGGTLARIEDIDAVVGDISTALTAILGE